jgi:hypothetical protein
MTNLRYQREPDLFDCAIERLAGHLGMWEVPIGIRHYSRAMRLGTVSGCSSFKNYRWVTHFRTCMGVLRPKYYMSMLFFICSLSFCGFLSFVSENKKVTMQNFFFFWIGRSDGSRWVPTETGNFKKIEWKREFLFNFFFAGTKLIWTHFSLCFMYNTRALANSSLKILPRGLHRLFLHSKGVIIFLLPTQFFWLGQR